MNIIKEDKVSQEPLDFDPNIGTDSTNYRYLYRRARFFAQYLISLKTLSIHDAELMFPGYNFEDIGLDEFMCNITNALFNK